MFSRWKKFYDTYKHREFFYLIPLILLSLAMRMKRFFEHLYSEKGFPHSDDGQWYLDYAYGLLADFRIGLHMNDIMYLGYNMLLTLLLALFRDPVAVIFIQALVAGFAVFFVYEIARMLFNRRTAVIASIFYSLSGGINLWAMYILSDSFFISLLLVCVYFLVLSLHTRSKLHKTLFTASALFLLIFRPTGVITLFFIFVYILLRQDPTKLKSFLQRYRWFLGGGLTSAVAVLVLLVLSGKLDPLIASLQYNAKLVLYNIYAKGWIYDLETPYDHKFKPDYTINILNSLVLSFIINNWEHVSVLYGKRILAFLGWWVWRSDFSHFVGVLKFIYHILATVLFLTGTIAAIKNGKFRQASVIWLVIFSIFVFCILLFIDGMYRYKAPALPFIAIAAAYGADRILQGFTLLTNNYTGMLLSTWNKKKY